MEVAEEDGEHEGKHEGNGGGAILNNNHGVGDTRGHNCRAFREFSLVCYGALLCSTTGMLPCSVGPWRFESVQHTPAPCNISATF